VEARREIFQSVNWRVRSSVWTPPTDVYETERNFVVRVELAGMREEDFEVALDEGVLTISGIRPDLNERRAYHQMEIWFGKFEIVVEVPVPVDVETSAAEYKDGFLMVILHKALPQQIKVES
jgi:HSP20 family protein